MDDSFDADLKRALEMSLEENKGHSGAGYVPSSQAQNTQANGTSAHTTSTKDKPVEEEEDADLKAAIAASIADMEEQKKAYAAQLKEQTASSTKPAASQFTQNNQFELTPVEAENINLFATLVDRLQHQPPGTILREPQIQELYESIGTLRPKLARTYGETMSKHDTLLDLHSKLQTAVRYYDRMLEDRLNSTYATGRYGQPAHTGMYPSLASASTGAAENYYTGPSAPSADMYTQPSQPPQVYPGYMSPPQPNPSSTPYPEQYPNIGAGRIPQSFPPGQAPPEQAYPQHPNAHPSQAYGTQHQQYRAPADQGHHPASYAAGQAPPDSQQYPKLPTAHQIPSQTMSASSGPSVAVSPSLEPATNFYFSEHGVTAPGSALAQHHQSYPSPEIQTLAPNTNVPLSMAPKEDSLIEL